MCCGGRNAFFASNIASPKALVRTACCVSVAPGTKMYILRLTKLVLGQRRTSHADGEAYGVANAAGVAYMAM